MDFKIIYTHHTNPRESNPPKLDVVEFEARVPIGIATATGAAGTSAVPSVTVADAVVAVAVVTAAHNAAKHAPHNETGDHPGETGEYREQQHRRRGGKAVGLDQGNDVHHRDHQLRQVFEEDARHAAEDNVVLGLGAKRRPKGRRTIKPLSTRVLFRG